jgi:hypothetical protein
LTDLSNTNEDFISLVEPGIKAPSFEIIEPLVSTLDTDVTARFTLPGEENDRQRVRMVRGNKHLKKAAAKKRSPKSGATKGTK